MDANNASSPLEESDMNTTCQSPFFSEEITDDPRSVDLFLSCLWVSYKGITQKAEAILNKISNNINKTYIGLISVLQGFQKCIA